MDEAPLNPDEVARYARHIVLNEIGGSGQQKLKAARVLVLENVPTLGRTNFNEAKRFVTLIDALYEARVRLIASAADMPERLYLEGAGAFEFERTASRLREMQSADWARE
jgi:cell division protein ZapE